jgi:hypothetical protein
MQSSWHRFAGREVLALIVFAIILAWQVLLPGFLGLANNGDFSKIAGRLRIGVEDEGADNFLYFKSDYVRAERYRWDSGLPSSELLIARTASGIERLLGDARLFDIRWLGALHALGFLAAFALWLGVLRPLLGLGWFAVTALAMLIVGDTGNVTYANSFYTDTPALIGALAALPAAVLAFTSTSGQGGSPRARRFQAGALIAFGAAAVLFVSSKGQHGILGLAPAAVLGLLANRASQTSARLLAGFLAAATLAGTVWVVMETPAWYVDASRFDVIFFKILPGAPSGVREAAELGLDSQDLQYTGKHSFLPDSPLFDPRWALHFRQSTSSLSLLRFYLRHPARTLSVLRRDLIEEAWQRRAVNLSNYRRQDGRPAGARSGRFGLWTDLRSRALHAWPWHIVFWCALLFVGVPLAAPWGFSGSGGVLLWAAWGAAVMGMGEFCVASLGDAIETGRHLLLFHVFTDGSILLVAVWACQRIQDPGPVVQTTPAANRLPVIQPGGPVIFG